MRSIIAKVLALTLALGLLLPVPLLAAITAVGSQHCAHHDSASGTTGGCTLPGATTTGNSLTACIYWNDATEGHLTSVTDGTNTWTLRPTTYVTQGGLSLKIADAINITGAGAPTITTNFSVANTDRTVSVQEFTNIASFDLGQTNTQTNVGTGTDADTTGATASRGQNNEMDFACSMSSNNSVTIAAGTNYTVIDQIGTGYATDEYQVFSSIGTQAATWTLGSGTTNNMMNTLGAYKDVVSGGGGGGSARGSMMLLGVGH